MPTYTLMGDYPMKRGGRHIQPGEPVKMTEAEAERYVETGRLELAKPEKPEPTKPNGGGKSGGEGATDQTPPGELTPEGTIAVIVEAIGKLDKDSAEAWTKGGAPQVSAIEAELGFQISGEQRDQAWAKIQAEAAKDNKNNT